ncbi:MAG: hypothetical protein EA340_11140 [Nitriliruptor sp.]|nr:MAG: hypothetical protein EA340_11140 [Nitriliruptor sp.]TVR19946.1 MAG: hypothetical protein EA387_12450 [Nitriliruptor sp.]
MLPSLSRLLPIPHLFMATSILACLLMVAAMFGTMAGEVVDGTSVGAVSVEGDRVLDAQGR